MGTSNQEMRWYVTVIITTSDPDELVKSTKIEPIICRLTDFGGARCSIQQTQWLQRKQFNWHRDSSFWGTRDFTTWLFYKPSLS